MSVARRHSRSPRCEALERRRHLDAEGFLPVTVNGTAGSDAIVVTADAATITVTVNGTALTYANASVAELIVRGGGEDDVAFVRANVGVAVTVEGNAGNDVVAVGNAAAGLDLIVEPVAVVGDGQSDTLLVDDAARAAFGTYTVTSALVERAGAAPVSHVDVRFLALQVGSGGSATQLFPPNALATVSGGAGDDELFVGAAALSVAARFAGGGGADRVTLDDELEAADTTHAFGAETYVRTQNNAPGGTLTFTAAEAVQLFAGSGADALVVDDAGANVALRLDGGPGADRLTVNRTAPAGPGVTFSGGPGLDDVQLAANGQPGVARLDGPGDYRAVSVAANKRLALAPRPGGGRYAVSAMGLAVDGGRVELNEHGVVVDYAGGASPAAGVRADIIAARTGGTWLGASGITTADPTDATPQPALSVGYRDATAAGTFLGTAHDATAVLLRATRAGDADLDGAVGFADLSAVAKNYGAALPRWDAGDFDYDGQLGFGDLSALAVNYGAALPAPAARRVAGEVLS